MAVPIRWGAIVLFSLLVLSHPASGAQGSFPEAQNRRWDVSVWLAAATGEENRNSFTEAQILSAGLFVGKMMTGEIGTGWRRGRLEYGLDVMPVFIQLTPNRLYGGGFEPVVLRWNSSLRMRRVAPYVELAGGAVRTNSNLPAGDTSMFNFTARGGGGIQIFTANRRSIDIGCRWWHVSNANLGVRNPEFNGIQLSLGYHWRK
jgi:hypothetical protein